MSKKRVVRQFKKSPELVRQTLLGGLSKATRKVSAWVQLVRRASQVVFFISLTVTIILSGLYFAPDVYYYLAPFDKEVISQIDQSQISSAQDVKQDELVFLPDINPNLPEDKWIIIPKIGVRTALRDTQDPEEALREGVWLSPDYGQPGSLKMPMIVAAHRWGYKVWWKDDYWKYHSFYFLPDLEEGDRVEIIADQRKWVYEIYAGDEGQEITDYSADLILYTCKFLNSPQRYFRYAKLIDLSLDSQG